MSKWLLARLDSIVIMLQIAISTALHRGIFFVLCKGLRPMAGVGARNSHRVAVEYSYTKIGHCEMSVQAMGFIKHGVAYATSKSSYMFQFAIVHRRKAVRGRISEASKGGGRRMLVGLLRLALSGASSEI
jgi:hypothetical protein